MPIRHGQSPKSSKSAAPATAFARRVGVTTGSKGHPLQRLRSALHHFPSGRRLPADDFGFAGITTASLREKKLPARLRSHRTGRQRNFGRPKFEHSRRRSPARNFRDPSCVPWPGPQSLLARLPHASSHTTRRWPPWPGPPPSPFPGQGSTSGRVGFMFEPLPPATSAVSSRIWFQNGELEDPGSDGLVFGGGGHDGGSKGDQASSFGRAARGANLCCSVLTSVRRIDCISI